MTIPCIKKMGVLALATLLLGAGAVWAQQTTGNVHGTVVDKEGSPLPGATVTLSGQGAPKVQVTDNQGLFRFLGLSPGVYKLNSQLDSFATFEHPNVSVNVGRNTTVEIQMQLAIEESITVTSESSLLDERKITTGTTVTKLELDKIPTARDPWVILETVPGVLVDRVNVGGNQSGQQSNFVGNGSGRASATWAVDGVTITDPAARGASPSYYDFDAFEEMNMSTGGSDITAMTAGVQLNLVTKRGTNQWRGSARFFNTGPGQADSSIGSGEIGRPGLWNNNNGQATSSGSLDDVENGNITDNIDEYGGDVGGPLLKDRLWIWGSYSFQDIETLAFGGTPDQTELENYATKLNAQLGDSNSLVGFFHYGDKAKFGRGAAATRPAPTTWNQSGPTDIYKLEDTHIFSSNFYLDGMYSHVGGGFQLIPRGGLGADAPFITRDESRVWHNSYFGYQTDRPQDQARIDGSYFFSSGKTNHELKFGVGFRHSEVYSISPIPGGALVGRRDRAEIRPGVYQGEARHTPLSQDEFDQKSLTIQDTITSGKLTVNVGLRYDLQEPEGGGVVIPAQPFFAEEMPAIVKPAPDVPFEWETLNPRVGVTYALGEQRRTLLRASYARFSDQLGTGFFNDLGVSTFRRGYFYWYDNNDNLVIEDNEIGQLYDISGSPGTASSNRVDPGLDPQKTDEIVLGIEHAVLPELVLGFSTTLRSNKDFVISKNLVEDPVTGELREATRADYAQTGILTGSLPDGTTYSYPVYGLQNRDPARGFVRQNSGLEQDYLGLSFTVTKRLSNRWMARGHFTWSDWTNEGRDPVSQVDPNRFVNSINGSQTLVQSAGSGSFSETWINSSWNLSISGLYQVAPERPWGFNLGGAITGREGYARPYRVSVSGTNPLVGRDRTTRSILVAPSNDSFRNDNIFLFNLRLEKEFQVGGVGLAVSVDAFNLFNTNTTLQREGFLQSTGILTDSAGNPTGDTTTFRSSNGDWIREALSPRIMRLGLRLNF